ncbi:MAG: helicase, partial [Pseudomonadota bacterium]
ALITDETLPASARGIAFQLVEALGILDRTKIASDVKTLDQAVRSTMRGLGVRFGAYHIYMPAILKPKPRALAAQLWFLKRGEQVSDSAANILQLALSGRTSWPADAALDPELYRVLGYKLFGARAVRVDILERLADLIRPILSYREEGASMPPPNGRVGRGFVATVEMTSLLGSSGEDMAHVLRGLGYVSETKQRADVEAQIKTENDTYYARQAPVEAPAEPAISEAATPAEPVANVIAEAVAPVVAETVQ